MQPNASVESSMQQQQMPQNQQIPQNQQAPVQTPDGGAGTSPGSVEWALAGFEIHPDGSVNPGRPIYRCPRCRRLNGVDMLAAGPAVSHSPQCVFSSNRSNDNMMYCSQRERAATNQQQIQQQERGYAAYPQLPEQSMSMSELHTSSTNSYGSNAMVDSSSLNAERNIVNISLKSEDVSPKTLDDIATSSAQRPAMTISPYMNKVATEGSMSGDSEPKQEPTPGIGNLFESKAFHNQMDMISMEKLFLNKNIPVEDDPAFDPQQPPVQNYQQDPSLSFGGVIGTSLFNEMTSMGINLDFYDKGESQLLGEFVGPGRNGATEARNGEDQVFYILARMYTDAQEQKLGLPAFDQFQRMVSRVVSDAKG